MYILGLDPNQVWDSLVAPGFKVGQLGTDDDGNIFTFLKATEAIAASDVVIIHEDGTASQLDTTTAAAGTGTGKPAAVAPPAPSQAIAANDYFWGCVRSLNYETGGVDSAAAHVELFATATGGKLDDVFDGDQSVRGITFHTALSGVTVEGAIINWPMVVNTIDS